MRTTGAGGSQVAGYRQAQCAKSKDRDNDDAILDNIYKMQCIGL